jgi:hypothetical protein
MDLDGITMPALTHFADRLPAEALSPLGSLAHIGLFLSGKSRRRFLRGLAAIFGYAPAEHKRGMRVLLEVPELDDGMCLDAVRDANRLRRKVALVERESVGKFFRALWGARALREYYRLLDPFEGEGEDTVDSILDGRAFRSGGLVSRLIGEDARPPERPAGGGDHNKQLPTYDPIARELRVGDVVMRRYGKFNYHEIILKAFRRAGWEKGRILIPRFFRSNPDRLGDTLDQLNTPQKGRRMLIRFRLHEKYIVWEWR